MRPGGTLILNADDENSLSVLERERVRALPKKIVYFSLDEDNPLIQSHLQANGTVYFAKDNWIVEATAGGRQTLVKIDSIPATMNGTAEFQIANVLAAVAACRAYGLWSKSIERLQTFQNDANNPGRNNLYRVGEGYALVDYGHNAGAFAAICRMASRWQDKIVTGIIGVPGDRDNRIIEDAGRIAAEGFHRVIIKEDEDLRGRTQGEVARLLCETVMRVAPDRNCEIVFDEIEAFENALRNMSKDEVIVLFFDKLEPVLEILQRYQAVPATTFEDSVMNASSAEFQIDA